MTETKAIAKFEPSKYLILTADEDRVKRVFASHFKNRKLNVFNLPTAKVPSGGGRHWKMSPSQSEDPREIRGVIIEIIEGRNFYIESFDQSGGGSPPDCSSTDLMNGFGDRGIPSDTTDGPFDCYACPHSQWKSDPKGERGQRCKERNIVLILRGDSVLPIAVSAPPTSLKKIQDFNTAMAGQLRELHEKEVVLTLEPSRNKDGIEYSEIALTIGNDVPQDAANKIEMFRQLLLGKSNSSEPQGKEP